MQAHAFGARYDLPLPLDLYMIGAAAAVVLSFLVMTGVFRAKSKGAGRWRFDLLRFAPARALLLTTWASTSSRWSRASCSAPFPCCSWRSIWRSAA